MPTYLYECQTCEKTFEVDQRITEDALTDCHCGSKGSLIRLVQPTAVMFKGSGFHINDYSETKAPPSCDNPGTDGSCACAAKDPE